jgi:hypothetical protein
VGGNHACFVSLEGSLANNHESIRKRINLDCGLYHGAVPVGDMQGRMVLEVMLDHMGCHTMGLVKSVAMRVCLHNMVVVNCSPESK